ncbi:MAG: alpha/beta hydrolase [Lentimicrobium sp.]|jgi:pimeloyl-ACP methyl ester carboxylesterase|uniref:alpha/beta hydrolase n=1 Tax=Lentimicrobium sp. TaxID=2034841 RepID=UPI0025E8AD58|nr:alpha/beta hydrolase [Lentimicrobium sp.]MCO5257350.1 alpha/beta hydrolase [Lentimicrobium sp.]
MKQLTIVTALISVFFLCQPAIAQTDSDSILIVEQALKMIAFPEPEFKEPYVNADLSPKAIADMGFDQPDKSVAVKFKMRDGATIHAEKYELESGKTIILVHGTLASSYTYNKMSGLLRESAGAEVIAIDLRGHGQSEGTPGDVTTLNQYAEDLEDIINTIKKNRPGQKIILAGHSMGGGIVLRHKETFPETDISAYILFAPNLGNNAPTMRTDLDLKNNFIKSHLSRGLGIRMLNEYGIHTYDSLKVVFYNLPLQMPLRSYSYRSMQAAIPIDYKHAIRSIDRPLIVLVGGEDEAFIAAEYVPLFNAYSKGECHIIRDETHNGIRHNHEAMALIGLWAEKGL